MTVKKMSTKPMTASEMEQQAQFNPIEELLSIATSENARFVVSFCIKDNQTLQSALGSFNMDDHVLVPYLAVHGLEKFMERVGLEMGGRMTAAMEELVKRTPDIQDLGANREELLARLKEVPGMEEILDKIAKYPDIDASEVKPKVHVVDKIDKLKVN